MTTLPSCPFSIDSMASPSLTALASLVQASHREPQRGPALPRLRRVLVVDAIGEPLHQVQAEPSRLALLDRLADVDVRRVRDVEPLDVAIDQRHLDATVDRPQPERHG